LCTTEYPRIRKLPILVLSPFTLCEVVLLLARHRHGRHLPPRQDQYDNAAQSYYNYSQQKHLQRDIALPAIALPYRTTCGKDGNTYYCLTAYLKMFK
jgi:hypothetical protein